MWFKFSCLSPDNLLYRYLLGSSQEVTILEDRYRISGGAKSPEGRYSTAPDEFPEVSFPEKLT
jgi:hypothetical protein